MEFTMNKSDQERDEAAQAEAAAADRRDPARKATRREGEQAPAYYYGRPPVYGGLNYGGLGYGAGVPYGAPYYGGGQAEGEADSLLGSLTFMRVLRVAAQKWPTLVVAVLLGLGGGFAYFKTAPVSYKAFSVIEMTVRRQRVMNTPDVILNPTEGSTDEIFNTRLAKLRIPSVIEMVAERVRADFPNLKDVPDDAMYEMLYRNVEFSLQRRSRLVEISARHMRAEIAQAIANAYAITAENYSMDENKAQSESGVAWLKSTAESQRNLVEQADDAVLDFRVENQIDVMENQRKAVDLVLQQLNSDLARSEGEQTRAMELLNVLTMIQQNPERISALPEVVPRASEIAAAQQALQNKIAERDALLMRYTDKHPDVLQASNNVEVHRKQYQDAVWRARETAAANLDLIRKQTESLREKTSANEKLSSELEQKIVASQMRLQQLEREREVSDMSYRAILRRMEEARLAIDDSSATIKVVRKAPLPQQPVSPDPRVAFTTGPLVGLLLGFLFILLLDRLEDRITSTSDIEQHMSTKVLTLIPHVPRIKRDELVVLSARKKFSRLAEAFAGLRGLLESPRYRELTKVILVVSTQPEEGKTITSGNLALTYAMSGQKTLLVDFDLRRPRVGRVFKIKSDASTSLVDVLAAGDAAAFDKLAKPSGFDNLDLVTSRVSAHISPANIMGSEIVGKFFEWIRAHYDHVIIDSPPFGLVSDAVVLGTLSDSVMLVCRPDRSRYRAIRYAIRQFLEAGGRLLGVVVNDVDFGRSTSFSNYDYRNYGYNYRYGRYGRYGYGYYKRSIDSAPAGLDATAGDEEEDVDDGEEATAPARSVLDLDDDE